MGNTRQGYWDIDRCAWVGVDPDHVGPPLTAEPLGALPLADRLPEPRATADAPQEQATAR